MAAPHTSASRRPCRARGCQRNPKRPGPLLCHECWTSLAVAAEFMWSLGVDIGHFVSPIWKVGR